MEFDLFLPATFGECAEDENDQWTWTSTAGTTHRLDYVAQSDNFRSNGVRGFVETFVDQCALIIDLWHATSFWLMEKATSGMIGDSLDVIGMRCNRMKRAQCVGQCCSTLPVLTRLLTLTHIWHFRMHTSHTLLGNVLRNSASRRKKLGFLISLNGTRAAEAHRRASVDGTSTQVALECIAKNLCGMESCARWQNPILILLMRQPRMCAIRSVMANEKEMSRLGAELKKSLANDKIQHVHTMVKAAFVERATGDDRAFWKGVRALRARGPGGARIIALENGELAPTPYAGRQRWQRHFAAPMWRNSLQ